MLAAEDVHVRFRKRLFRRIHALNGLSLQVREGEFYALVGQNGAGKSTAMYCLLGLIRPEKGRVTMFGRSPELGSDLYREVGYLPEEPHYHAYLTVREAVDYYGSLYGGRVTSREVDDWLDRLGMAEFRSLRVDKCSKGMKQKVGIAQCLIGRPRLIFLDEPTRGLDPIAVKEFRDILVDLHRSGVTIVMNSHALSETERLATRVAIINRGRVEAEGEMRSFLAGDVRAYEVEIETTESVPEFVAVAEKRSNVVRGSIPSERLHDFMEFAKQTGARVIECSLKKSTLEESYIRIVKGEGRSA